MDEAIYRLLAAGARFLSWIPPFLLRPAGRLLGEIAFWVDRRHRAITRKNLRLAYGPELGEAEIHDLARACFRHLGQVAVDIVAAFEVPSVRLRRRVRFRGLENLDAARKQGRGVILLMAHYGNWELYPLLLPLVLGEFSGTARPLDSVPLERLMTRIRSHTGTVVHKKLGSVRQMLTELRSGGVTGMLMDQNVDWYHGVFVFFFGRRACTNRGLARLHQATGSPVVPCYSYYEQGRYHLALAKPLDLVRLSDRTKMIEANTQTVNSFLEAMIRRRPEQWFWLHQRFKTWPWHKWPRVKRGKDEPNWAPEV
ncbi:MAG: lysophospholipid acyltransferase family protein [Proteobacteria bacterium]|nr:lysophospholipid acyltransferase family protein [Pseudomonadota bacterium]